MLNLKYNEPSPIESIRKSSVLQPSPLFSIVSKNESKYVQFNRLIRC